MSDLTTERKQQFNRTLDRFIRLTPPGRRDFLARIVAASRTNAVLEAEVALVMRRLETDADNGKCWLPPAESGASGEKTAPAPEPEAPSSPPAGEGDQQPIH